MSTTDLSEYDPSSVPDAGKMSFGIVVSDWNQEITQALLKGAKKTLIRHGAKKDNIIVRHVPGSFELPLGAQIIVDSHDLDAIICIGCVIQGETPHFTFICESVSHGIMRLNLEYKIPFIFGVLTTNTMEQAKARSGGIHGNKGDEAAITAIKMAFLKLNIRK